MKLGLFDHMQKHDNPGRSYLDLYKSHLEVLEFADRVVAAGFSVCLPHLFGVPGQDVSGTVADSSG